eukprot:2449082-Prymnesium_polylepis.1
MGTPSALMVLPSGVQAPTTLSAARTGWARSAPSSRPSLLATFSIMAVPFFHTRSSSLTVA